MMKPLKNRKSQSISINTIIVAVIAIVVLLVMILIFTGKIRMFGESIEDCEQRGGICDYPDANGKCRPVNGKDVYVTIKNTNCDKDNMLCCVKIL